MTFRKADNECGEGGWMLETTMVKAGTQFESWRRRRKRLPRLRGRGESDGRGRDATEAENRAAERL